MRNISLSKAFIDLAVLTSAVVHVTMKSGEAVSLILPAKNYATMVLCQRRLLRPATPDQDTFLKQNILAFGFDSIDIKTRILGTGE
jgi:hypothetical protein